MRSLLSLVLNIIWLIFGGLWLALGYLVAALICFVLLIAWRTPAWAVVIVGAAGGILITLIG